MDDVQPLRSMADLRDDVERRAAKVRQRDRLKLALPAAVLLAVAAIGLGLIAAGDDSQDVRTIEPVDRPEENSVESGSVDADGDQPSAPVVPDGERPAAGEARPESAPPDTTAPVESVAGTIVFSSNRDGDHDLYAVRPDGTGLRQLSSAPGDDLDAAVSPDGSLVAFRRSNGASTRYEDARVYVTGIDGRNLREIGLPSGIWLWPSWSPDGRQLALVHENAVWVADVDGGDARQVTPSSPAALWPAWSPDGREIAYTAFDGTDTSVRAVDLESGYTRTIVGSAAGQASWSPDGQLLAFRRTSGSGSQIHVVGRDGRNMRPVTRSGGWDSDPHWSPDGRSLVFDRDPDGHDPPSCFIGVRDASPVRECLPGSNGPMSSTLWVVASDGSGLRQVTANTTAVDMGASWGRT